MSASTQPRPSLPTEPEPPQRAPLAEQRGFPWRLILPGAVLVLVVIGIYLLWLRPQERVVAGPATALRTATVTAGTFVRTIRLAGQTSARHFANITVPLVRAPDSRREMTLIKLAKPGTMIRQGEILAQIDAQSLQDHIDDTNDSVLQAANDVKRRVAEQAVDWENLQQTLRVAKGNLNKAELDLKAAEVKTDIEREFYKLAVDEARAKLKQQEAEIPITQERHRAERRILEISHERQAIHRDHHVSDLQKFTIRAPMSGLVVMQQVHRHGESGQIQEGDQVNPGQAIAKIVDPRSMQVEAQVNQAEATELRLGQDARIGLDAFPDAQFRGKVYSIGALAIRPTSRESYYIRTVPVRVLIDGNDPRLIPDLSAWADVEIERKANTLMVPLGAVHWENGRSVVWVNRGGKFEKRVVELGSRNHTHAAVVSGLRAGDVVALERPEETAQVP